jgi:hypothetical protein
MVVFAEEDVAAREIWHKTEDGQADGFQLLLSNVLVFVMLSPETACFEFAVEYRSPTMA